MDKAGEKHPFASVGPLEGFGDPKGGRNAKALSRVRIVYTIRDYQIGQQRDHSQRMQPGYWRF